MRATHTPARALAFFIFFVLLLLACRYELCNKYGLYMVDEANVETHGFDPGLCNNPVNPACSPLWLHAIVGACCSLCPRLCASGATDLQRAAPVPNLAPTADSTLPPAAAAPALLE